VTVSLEVLTCLYISTLQIRSSGDEWTEDCKPSVALLILKEVLRKALLSEASLRMLNLKEKLEEESTQKSYNAYCQCSLTVKSKANLIVTLISLTSKAIIGKEKVLQGIKINN
jgi:hypothetical protein